MITDNIQINNIVPSFGTNNKKQPTQTEYNGSSTKIPRIQQPSFLVQATEDNQYRVDLLKTIGKSRYTQYNIQSIMGPYETKNTLLELQQNEQNFIASDENIKNGKFRANLHIHTNASDGFYSPKELLNDAAEYSDKVWEKTGRPFVIAVTDHDTTSAYPEIISEIYENPKKYRHLKVILGMESTTYEDVNNKPMQFHMLVYNINPTDKKFADFMKNQEDNKAELTKTVIKDINTQYKEKLNKDEDLLSYDEFSNAYPVMNKKILSPHNYLRKYTMTKLLVSDVIPKTRILKSYFDETNPDRNPNIEMERIKASQYESNHNNAASQPLTAVTDYYSKVTDITPEELEQAVYEQAIKSDNLMNFVSEMNNQLLNHRNINGRNFYVNISDVYNALSEQPQAILGIAHPLSTVVDKTSNDTIDLYKNIFYKSSKEPVKPKGNKTPEFLEAFYDRFKEEGKEKALFSEVFYQSYSTKKSDIQTPPELKETLEDLSTENNMLKTGGYDSHRKSIFTRYW